MPSPTSKQIDALLPFLERFEADGFSPGEWDDSSGQLPYFVYEDVVAEFQQALYENGWITPDFDWTEWQESADNYVESPTKIESVDAEIVRRLFTTHVRKERFCEGHLATMFQSGYI